MDKEDATKGVYESASVLPRWLSPSLCTSFLLLVVCSISNFAGIRHWLGSFALDLIFLIIFVLFVCGFLGSIVKAIKTNGEPIFTRFRFVLLNVLMLLLLLPLEEAATKLDFKLNLDKRLAAVAMAKKGELEQVGEPRRGFFLLPAKLSHLSSGGEVYVYPSVSDLAKGTYAPEDMHVRFYEHVNYGIEYSADDTPPVGISSIRLQKRWYSFSI